MVSFGNPIPRFEYCDAAVDKRTSEMVAVNESTMGPLADAIERTGLPWDEFEVYQTSLDRSGVGAVE
jgi:hypothetical protein